MLEGQTRYAHMASSAGAELDAEALGMKKIPSEDSVCAALMKLVDPQGDPASARQWLNGRFDRLGEVSPARALSPGCCLWR